MFSMNYQYLCDQARKATFGLKSKLNKIGKLPPNVMLYLFDSVIKPVLTYGSDVWGVNKSGQSEVDKVFLHFARCTLKVKATTSNVIVYGETGHMPPSVSCITSALMYANRFHHMESNKIAKQVYVELCHLHDLGFQNWVSKMCKLAKYYSIDIEMDQANFKKTCKAAVVNHFKSQWAIDVTDLKKNPILRTYSLVKRDFKLEPYLHLVKKAKYRSAITQLRASSHTLEIERGRHTRPKTAEENRLCATCNMVEDEEHFVTACNVNCIERANLYQKVTYRHPVFQEMTSREKFIFLFTNECPQILSWLGKFINESFIIRNTGIYT